MKSVQLVVSGDTNAAYQFQESAVVRRVILSGGGRTTTTLGLEVAVRKGGGSSANLAHGDTNVVAAFFLLMAGTVGMSHAIDVPCYELVNPGDSWHIVLNAISGASGEQLGYATLWYEPQL